MDLSRPLKLSPNLFTPLTRTPWAGREIARRFKVEFAEKAQRIGESWEVSCDPAMPSRIEGGSTTLQELILMEPEAMLSPLYFRKFGANCEILIKLLNADDPLSVQVHPTDADSWLKKDECGKPESWLVLAAEPGSGLYLGFQKPIGLDLLRELLQRDGDLRPHLQFVPVKPGDYFEIEPGVIHAIGPGVTLLEPQRVVAGKAGKTYRFWDWGRRYDASGQLDPQKGQPRELHIEEGLRLIDPLKQHGPKYVAGLRRSAEVRELGESSRLATYPANPYYQVHHLKVSQGDRIELKLDLGFATLVMLSGDVRLNESVALKAGEPSFVPHAALPLSIEGLSDAELAIVHPASAELTPFSFG